MKNSYYKYRALYQYDEKGKPTPHQHTKSIFAKGELYFAAPETLNDPFDCNLKLHVNDSTDAEWEAYCDAMILKEPSRKAQIEKVKSEKLWRTRKELSDNIGAELHAEIYQKSSVLCLAKKNDSIPMFSYYTDSHKGIAIEFQFEDFEVPCGIPCGDLRNPQNLYQRKVIFRDVEYPPAYPELNYHRVRNDDRLVRGLMFTKHHEWGHEKEFRIFRRGVPAAAVPFEKGLLKRVIFGCKTTQAEVDLVKSWIVDWPTDVVLSKAAAANDRFELVVTDFEVIKGKGKP